MEAPVTKAMKGSQSNNHQHPSAAQNLTLEFEQK
jgi:hypothetical protein